MVYWHVMVVPVKFSFWFNSMVYWHIMVIPVKFYFWFNSYINSQTSVELAVDKMQNFLTKEEPNGTYNTDLHELHLCF